MNKILGLLILIVVAAQAYVIPGNMMAPRGMSFGNPYNDPLSFTELSGGVAGGVANQFSGLGSSLGGIGGHLNGLRGPLGGLGGPLGGFGGQRNVGGMGGLMGPGGYGSGYESSRLIAPQGLSMDYGFLRG